MFFLNVQIVEKMCLRTYILHKSECTLLKNLYSPFQSLLISSLFSGLSHSFEGFVASCVVFVDGLKMLDAV